MTETKHRVSFDSPMSPAAHRSPHAPNTDLSKLSLPYTTDPPSPSNPAQQKVWLIFGATGHMGRSVTKAALAHDDIVAAVGQSYQDAPSSMEKWHEDKNRYLGLLCDVRIRSSVSSTIEKTMQSFGRIDIIANCSGYGVIGACEDQDEHETRNQFETNFMGTLNIIQLSLPYFRKRQNGRYLIFSSTSGALGVPGLGPYCASKYAVEGLIESMLYEVAPFNINLTLVEPGHLRRDDNINIPPPPQQPVSQTNTSAPNAAGAAINGKGQTPPQQQNPKQTDLPLFGHFKVARPSSPYSTKDSPAAHTQRTLQWMGANQPTSVVKAAELVWQLGHCRYPPVRLLLGSFAVESIRDRLKSIIEEIEDWKHLSFPPMEGFEEKEDDEDGDEHDDGVKEDEAVEQGEGEEEGEGEGEGEAAAAAAAAADGEPAEGQKKDEDAGRDAQIKLESQMDLDE
ncbi:short chain dehydrogenase/reductase family protein [Cladophialophora carrionii]|uniref:Short chain dehydrogenase/reductase family protein n=1 Tax=Cladophialophora carrionii TaxID=86049 RepID=A0A1C1D088_9EURO|nr:short chain dehydrogenase/reductase family protein [Cladophialophora carrionii]